MWEGEGSAGRVRQRETKSRNDVGKDMKGCKEMTREKADVRDKTCNCGTAILGMEERL